MKLDAIVNIVTMLTCVLIVGYIVGDRPRRPAAPSTPYARGETIADTGSLRLSESKAAIILVTASTCRYCTESMPFYQRLAAAAANAGVEVIAATTEPVESNTAYLQAHSIEPKIFVSSRDAQIAVRGTPTLILTKGQTVVNSWLGRLTESEERDVLKAIRATQDERQ